MMFKKRPIACLLAVILCLSLAACGQTPSSTASDLDTRTESDRQESVEISPQEEAQEESQEEPAAPNEDDEASNVPEEMAEEPVPVSTSLRITAASDFSCGRAFVRYETVSDNPMFASSEGSTLACIDTSGTVLFTLPDDVRVDEISGYQNGYASFSCDGHGLCIIDLEGNLIFDESAVRAETEFDDIIAYGDQYVLCHKEVLNFDTNEDLYSIYDGLNQDWCFAFQNISSYPDQESVRYAGDGVFVDNLSGGYSPDFFNLITPDYSDEDNRYVHETDYYRAGTFSGRPTIFVNGKSYGSFDTDYQIDGEIGYLTTDGEIFYMEELAGYKKNILSSENEEVTCFYYSAPSLSDDPDDCDRLIIIYHEDDSAAIFQNEILEHKVQETSLIVEKDVIVLLGLEGADRELYYAAYRTDGTELLPPTLQNTSEITYQDGRFQIGDGHSPVFLDAEGNEIFHLSGLGLEYFSGFSEGLGYAEDDSDYQVYLDTNGNIVINELTVSPGSFTVLA